jgi:hypothetical protein
MNDIERSEVAFDAGVVARIALAAVLLAAAAAAWRVAATTDAVAAAHQATATLTPTPVAGESRWLLPLAALIDSDFPRHAATGAYWSHRYAELTDPSRATAAESAATLLLSANAAFRQAQVESAARPLGTARLDQLLQNYAGVLKNRGFDRDAAYNFEFLARLRDLSARARPSTAKPDVTAPDRGRGSSSPDDLPAGPTIHGAPGTHPPATRGEEFEMLTPMNFGDREAQPEPTPGVRLPKKG